MHSYDTGVLAEQHQTTRRARGKSGSKLRALAAAMLTLAATVPPGFAQQEKPGTTTTPNDKASSPLPVAPQEAETKPCRW
ncbi:MAG TPA: hypothetical protein VKR52_01375, partial [Terracidiphilus sp.]|nr:hypothetical protein [Terracidiphilus sp.]